jgi:hypothetical protein
MTLSALGIFSAAGAGGVVATGTYELIETFIVSGSSTSAITFSNLGTYSSTYKHLQIRAVHRDSTVVAATTAFWLRFNGVTSTSYAWHRITSTLSSDNAFNTTRILAGISASSSATSDAFSSCVIDILDPYSTTKNKTIRALGGVRATNSSELNLNSGLFNSTAAITSIELTVEANLVAGSRFSIYGLRG